MGRCTSCRRRRAPQSSATVHRADTDKPSGQASDTDKPSGQASDDRGPGTPDDANLWSVVGRLLPTPAVNDMGAGKDPQAWDDWTERMKEAHGNGNGHGKSLEQEALRMLPTPRGQDEYERRNYKTMVRIRDQGGDMTLPTWATVVAPSLGDSTSQQLGAGSRSSDDQHQPPLFDAKPATD
jgi:hypothetical protein